MRASWRRWHEGVVQTEASSLGLDEFGVVLLEVIKEEPRNLGRVLKEMVENGWASADPATMAGGRPARDFLPLPLGKGWEDENDEAAKAIEEKRAKGEYEVAEGRHVKAKRKAERPFRRAGFARGSR